MSAHIEWDDELWIPITSDISDDSFYVHETHGAVDGNRVNSFFDHQPQWEQYELPGLSSYPTFD